MLQCVSGVGTAQLRLLKASAESGPSAKGYRRGFEPPQSKSGYVRASFAPTRKEG
jgi:hypothetical protein